MLPIHHPVLSPSPLQNAFSTIPWMYGDNDQPQSSYRYSDNGNSSFHDGDDDDDNENFHRPGSSSNLAMLLSKPELLVLQSAEENPLEYTLAEYDEAFLYVRVLLKLLDQVASVSAAQPSRNRGSSNNNNTEQQRSKVSASYWGGVDCGTQLPLSKDDALHVYSYDKIGVTTHYVITKLYELMGVLIDRQLQEQRRRRRISSSSSLTRNNGREQLKVSILTLFVRRQDDHMHVVLDDWTSLMRLLYRSDRDNFSKRGAALVLAYILIAGSEAQLPEETPTRRDSLLLLPPLESRSGAHYATDVMGETVQSLISWLASRLQSSSHNTSLGIVTPTLMVLATLPKVRRAFAQAGGVGYLSRHIKNFHRDHQRHKQLMNRRYKYHRQAQQQSEQFGSDRSASSSSQNGQADSGIAMFESVSSVVSTALSHMHPQLTDISRISSASVRQSLSYGNSIHRSSNGSGRSIAREAAAYVSESTSHLVSEMVSMIPSPTALIGNASPDGPFLYNGSSSQRPQSSLGANGGGPSPASNRETTSSLSSTSSSSVQQLYELVYTLWCMALDGVERPDIRLLLARNGVGPALVQLLHTSPREKILRLAVATLRLLATLDDGGDAFSDTVKTASPTMDGESTPTNISSTAFVREMIACNIQKPLDLLQQRQWNDTDLQEDIDALCDTVQAQTKELTQWKVYQAELESGVLRWRSQLHCSKFFRENARLMEGPGGDFAPLQRLVQILYRHTLSGRLSNAAGSKTMYVGLKEVVVSPNGGAADDRQCSWDQDDISDDELCETLAVALYDIGEFARHYPNGRGVIAAAGRLQWTQSHSQQSIIGKTKSLVMQYMQHPREEVQEQALSCISKLLVRNWRVSDVCQGMM